METQNQEVKDYWRAKTIAYHRLDLKSRYTGLVVGLGTTRFGTPKLLPTNELSRRGRELVINIVRDTAESYRDLYPGAGENERDLMGTEMAKFNQDAKWLLNPNLPKKSPRDRFDPLD